MDNIYQAAAELVSQQQGGAFCVIVRSQGSTPRHVGSKMLVYVDGSIAGTVGGGELENRVIAEALQAIQDGQPRLLSYNMADPSRGDPGVCGGQVEVYVEPVLPNPTLVVIGSGHVGKAVAHLAHWLGYRVVVSDDRPEFCTPQAVPEADEYIPVLMNELPEHLAITPWTYLVLTTRWRLGGHRRPARPPGQRRRLHRCHWLAAALGDHPQGPPGGRCARGKTPERAFTGRTGAERRDSGGNCRQHPGRDHGAAARRSRQANVTNPLEKPYVARISHR